MRLTEILKSHSKPAFVPHLGNPKSVIDAANSIRDRWPNLETMNDHANGRQHAEELRRRIKDDDWQDYYWSDLVRVANTVFASRELRTEFQSVSEFLIDQIRSDASRVFLGAMFSQYLATYEPMSEVISDFATALKRNQCWRKIMPAIDSLVSTFHILDPDRHPHKLIANFMKEQDSPFEEVQKKGIRAPHGQGIMSYAQYDFISQLALNIERKSESDIDQLLNWMCPVSAQPLQGNYAPMAIDALLLPWRDEEPGPDLKKRIESRLCEAYGDPRVKVGVWGECNDEAKGVMCRWMTSKTIDLFFDIVSQVNGSHMWPDRKIFWENLLREGQISDAWFALSESGAAKARKIKEDDDLPLEFATNVSKNKADREKCLLLMKVNDRLVVEGTHNFAVRVFPSPIRTRVRLRQERYDCDAVRSAGNMEGAKLTPHNGDWQNRVMIDLWS